MQLARRSMNDNTCASWLLVIKLVINIHPLRGHSRYKMSPEVISISSMNTDVD